MEPRISRWVGSVISGSTSPPASRRSIRARPASSAGLATVVSGGWQKSAPKMSSKPTTLTCAGTATPRSLQPAQHADGQQVVERHQRGRPAGQPDVGGRRTAVEGRRERAAAGRSGAGRRGVGGQRPPALGVGPGVGRPGEVGERRWPSAARCSTICRLPSAESVTTLGSPSTSRLNSTTGRRPAAPAARLGQPAGGEHEPVHRRAQPVQVGGLQLGAALGVAEDQGVAGRPGLRLGPADQSEVVRVGDVGDQQGQHPRAARGQRLGDPVGPVAQPARDRLHVLAGARADPVRVGQRTGHRGHRDAGLAGDVVQRHRPRRRAAVRAQRRRCEP